jgi:hypothetical protein
VEKDSSSVVTAFPSTPVTISRSCWFAIARTGAYATSISTAGTSAQLHSVSGGHASVSFHGEYAVVSELEGCVTILDGDNVPVAFVGDNPQKAQWAKYDLDPRTVNAAVFSAAHGCFIDADANIFASD